jgi:hypothetical protein
MLEPTSFRYSGVRVHGEKVFKIRWDNAGGFKIVHYDRGDWEKNAARLLGPDQGHAPAEEP